MCVVKSLNGALGRRFLVPNNILGSELSRSQLISALSRVFSCQEVQQRWREAGINLQGHNCEQWRVCTTITHRTKTTAPRDLLLCPRPDHWLSKLSLRIKTHLRSSARRNTSPVLLYAGSAQVLRFVHPGTRGLSPGYCRLYR